VAKDFASRLIRWHKHHGRHDLPWQNTRDPYRVWLSEIMLQQTQVAAVIPYYARFLGCFPSLSSLAAAPVADVMALWSGLGYYARARNLHACARAVMSDHGGVFPHQPETLLQLPGIGRSTANSIATFCFGAQAPILDGNVKRVLCRAFAIEGFPGNGVVEKRLWKIAAELMPLHDGGIYNQAQMDLGSTVCTRSQPKCPVCPLKDSCLAHAAGRTAELPHAKPRQAVPERYTALLALLDGGQVLLETRPPVGIWGGLLSLPELPEGADPADFVRGTFGYDLVAVSPAPTFVHAFSHFRLHITPLICQVNVRPQARESGYQWIKLQEAGAAALPAPIRRILLECYQAAGSMPFDSSNR
jgi:A/G-specific adenine glycosylase